MILLYIILPPSHIHSTLSLEWIHICFVCRLTLDPATKRDLLDIIIHKDGMVLPLSQRINLNLLFSSFHYIWLISIFILDSYSFFNFYSHIINLYFHFIHIFILLFQKNILLSLLLTLLFYTNLYLRLFLLIRTKYSIPQNT